MITILRVKYQLVTDLYARFASSGLLTEHLLFLFLDFLGSFAFSALHLVIIVDVAALALALSVDGALACMGTVGSERASAVFMVAVVAHAHGVQGQVDVLARSDLAFLGA